MEQDALNMNILQCYPGADHYIMHYSQTYDVSATRLSTAAPAYATDSVTDRRSSSFFSMLVHDILPGISTVRAITAISRPCLLLI